MKRKITKIVLYMFITLTAVSSVSQFADFQFGRIFTSKNNMLILGITILLFIYYTRLNKNPQYAHATINMEKKEKEQGSNEFLLNQKSPFRMLQDWKKLKMS
jgi:cell division protease FtsH